MTFSGPCGQRRDHRDQARRESLLDCGRRRGRRIADEAERLDPSGVQPDRITEERHGGGADRRAHGRVHLRERGADDVQHLGRRHPPALDEGGHDPAPLHLGRDLRPGAVDDDDVVSGGPQGQRLARSLRRDAPTQLEDDPAHVVYSALIRT